MKNNEKIRSLTESWREYCRIIPRLTPHLRCDRINIDLFFEIRKNFFESENSNLTVVVFDDIPKVRLKTNLTSSIAYDSSKFSRIYENIRKNIDNNIIVIDGNGKSFRIFQLIVTSMINGNRYIWNTYEYSKRHVLYFNRSECSFSNITKMDFYHDTNGLIKKHFTPIAVIGDLEKINKQYEHTYLSDFLNLHNTEDESKIMGHFNFTNFQQYCPLLCLSYNHTKKPCYESGTGFRLPSQGNDTILYYIHEIDPFLKLNKKFHFHIYDRLGTMFHNYDTFIGDNLWLGSQTLPEMKDCFNYCRNKHHCLSFTVKPVCTLFRKRIYFDERRYVHKKNETYKMECVPHLKLSDNLQSSFYQHNFHMFATKENIKNVLVNGKKEENKILLGIYFEHEVRCAYKSQKILIQSYFVNEDLYSETFFMLKREEAGERHSATFELSSNFNKHFKDKKIYIFIPEEFCVRKPNVNVVDMTNNRRLNIKLVRSFSSMSMEKRKKSLEKRFGFTQPKSMTGDWNIFEYLIDFEKKYKRFVPFEI
ncbi:hypothetical protein SNEBB_003594 [Seison nebaliae]|nr:hypothetical protein SNEBB_003594 [Seison nebaliae]